MKNIKYIVFTFFALFSFFLVNDNVFAASEKYKDMAELIEEKAKSYENWSFSIEDNELVVSLNLGKISGKDVFHSGFYLADSYTYLKFLNDKENDDVALVDPGNANASSGYLQYTSKWNKTYKKDYSDSDDVVLSWTIDDIANVYNGYDAEVGIYRLASFDPSMVQFHVFMSNDNKNIYAYDFYLDFNIIKMYWDDSGYSDDNIEEGSSNVKPFVLNFSTTGIAKYDDYENGAKKICERKADEAGKTGDEKQYFITSCASTTSTCLKYCANSAKPYYCRSECGEEIGDMRYGTTPQTQSFTCDSAEFYFTFDIVEGGYGRFTIKKDGQYVSLTPGIYFLDKENGGKKPIQNDNQTTNSVDTTTLYAIENENIYYIANCSGTYTFELIDTNDVVIYDEINQGKGDQIDPGHIDGEHYDEEPDDNDYESYPVICGIFKSEEAGGKLFPIIKNLYRMLKIAIPILVVILTIVEFLKVLFSGEDKTMKDAFKATTTRFILIAVTIFLPIIIEFIIKTAGFSENCMQKFIG